MLVCHCKCVSDREVREAVREGARTRRDVVRSCRAGTDCGGCLGLVDAIIESERSVAAGGLVVAFPVAVAAR